MSPRTTTVLCPRLRASRNVSIAFETLFGLARVAKNRDFRRARPENAHAAFGDSERR